MTYIEYNKDESENVTQYTAVTIKILILIHTQKATAL